MIEPVSPSAPAAAARPLDPNAHLFALARTARRRPHPVLIVVLFFAFPFLGALPGALLLQALGLPDAAASPLAAAVAQVARLALPFGSMILILALWVLVGERRPVWTLGLEGRDAGLKLLRGIAIGFGMFGSVVLLLALPGFVAPEVGTPGWQGTAALGAVLLVFLGWFVQSSGEEVLCRGWLLPVVGARFTPLVGVVVSSALFSLLHLLNPNFTWVAAVNIALIGVVFALYAIWEGGIWGPCGLHAAWNWAQGNVFGFEVSGTRAGNFAFIDLHSVGPDLVTGGTFGPEAGLAATLVEVVVLACFVALLRRRAARCAAR